MRRGRCRPGQGTHLEKAVAVAEAPEVAVPAARRSLTYLKSTVVWSARAVEVDGACTPARVDGEVVEGLALDEGDDVAKEDNGGVVVEEVDGLAGVVEEVVHHNEVVGVADDADHVGAGCTGPRRWYVSGGVGVDVGVNGATDVPFPPPLDEGRKGNELNSIPV